MREAAEEESGEGGRQVNGSQVERKGAWAGGGRVDVDLDGVEGVPLDELDGLGVHGGDVGPGAGAGGGAGAGAGSDAGAGAGAAPVGP